MKLAFIFAVTAASCLLATNGRLLLQSDSSATGVVQGQISGGEGHTCTIVTNGTLYCWGDNSHGELGNIIDSVAPIPIPRAVPGETWMQVSCGFAFTCGVITNGTAYCWGEGYDGQLGDGTFYNSSYEVVVAPADYSGGSPAPIDNSTPRAVAGNGTWIQISAGQSHACGIKQDNTAWCWGSNNSGQLGDGTGGDTFNDKSSPTPVAGNDTWTQISAGTSHTCGVKTDKTLACWGGNYMGQLGYQISNPDKINPTPATVGGKETWIQISSRGSHTCGITTDGTAVCWGDNKYGALGDGKGSRDNSNSELPQLVVGGLKWLQIAAGVGSSTCGIASNYTGFCWGNNLQGEVGDGTSGNWRSAPVAIAAPGVSWAEISAGYEFSCGITDAELVMCWGSDEYGTLGSEGGNSNIPKATALDPPLVPSLSGTSSSGSAPIGAIVGGVVGGIAIITAITAGFMIQKRRKASKGNANTENIVKISLYPAKTTPTEDSLAVSSMSTMKTSSDPVLQWIATKPSQDLSTTSLRSSSSKSSSIPEHLKAMEFVWKDARILKQLGSGSFGTVYLAELHHSPVAIKLFFDTESVSEMAKSSAASGFSSQNTRASSAPSMASTDALVKEVSLMAPLRHPNVALMVGYCMNPPSVAMEFASGGSVFDALQRGNSNPAFAAKLTWQRRLAMAADAAAGMLHLHTRAPPILHRDLKSPNLLLAADWTVKVADMGLSKLMDETTQESTAGGAANPRWLAPEVLGGKRPTAASDVFSFGVVMWELLTWKLPWSDTATVWNIIGNVLEGGRLSLPPVSELPGLKPSDKLDAYIALMKQCWAQDPSSRPNFNTIASELRKLQSV